METERQSPVENGYEDAVKPEDGSLLSQDAQRVEDEVRLVRRLDRRILPITCLLYLFACSFFNCLRGLPHDVLGGDPTGKRFDWINSIFFFAYILFQVPASITSKLYPPRIWIACAAFGWGVSSTLMATAFNFGGLMVGRIFLGVFEAGFGPVIPLYLFPGFFYTKEEIGRRLAYWFGFAAVAGAFGGLIAFGIQHAHTALQNWRLLFIIEGLPAIIMGFIALILLPDRPESTKFFNEAERVIAVDRMNRSTSGDVGATVNKAHILMAFRDWRIYTGGAIYFGLNCALASISAFLPTIIASFGHSTRIAHWIIWCSYGISVAAVLLLSFAHASDKLQSRGIFMGIASTISGIGYVYTQLLRGVCVIYVSPIGMLMQLLQVAHNLGSETKRATGIPMFMSIGQCGSVLGSHIFPLTEGPRYIATLLTSLLSPVSCALQFLAAFLSIVLSISYRMDNARRDKLYGKSTPNRRVETAELADKANEFRYVC
ncbi:MFS general substrate transporter [Mycena rebaudengoi]|nr:MFS general substrate transporter [Mycena rebaudengoi]